MSDSPTLQLAGAVTGNKVCRFCARSVKEVKWGRDAEKGAECYDCRSYLSWKLQGTSEMKKREKELQFA